MGTNLHSTAHHSNGDQASEMHCFRILIAAPPVFVTDPTGQITPFSDQEDANGVKVWRSIVDTTGVKAAYREISFRVGQTRELIFLAQVSPLPPPRSSCVCVRACACACACGLPVHAARLRARHALFCRTPCLVLPGDETCDDVCLLNTETLGLEQDPNPTDSVEIFILADPGIPNGMSVGLSNCVVREGAENSMCKADDTIERETYPDQDWSATFSFDATSRCSRAKRQVSWTPQGDAAGETFKVCAVARDDSSQCFGTASEFATQRGWFGEQQCVIIDVLRLLVNWGAPGSDFANLGTGDWVAKAYVGCEFKFHLAVGDALADPNDANDTPYPLVALLQDTGLEGAVAPQSANLTTLDATWVPGRGSEGKSFYMCFAARDEAGILSEPTNLVCHGGGNHLLGCYSDGDCDGGVCERACIRLDVQRCEYCVKGADTLTWMMRYFKVRRRVKISMKKMS